MKKRLFVIAVLAVFAVAVFAGCAGSQTQPSASAPASASVAASPSASASVEASPSASASASVEASPSASASAGVTLAKVKSAGKLVVGLSADYPPYEFHKVTNGKDEIKGFDVEIAKEVAKALGVELELKDIPFDGLLAALTSGKIDIIISGMEPKEERKQSVDFSDIYYNSDQGILVRSEDASKYTTIDSLKDKKVGAQMGSTQESILKAQLKDSKPVSMQKVPDLILALTTKKIEAMVCEIPVAQNYIKNYPTLAISQIKVSAETLGNAVAVNKNNPDLLEAINGVIKQLKDANKVNDFYAAADKESSAK